MSSLFRTSLYDKHVALGAKMVPFAGWEMPVQYENLKDEVLAVRNHVGVFDVSHMGEFVIEGSEAINFLDYLVTNDILNAPMGKAIYSPLCRENGTVIDDLIVYKLHQEKLLICVNASNIEKDWKWLLSKMQGFKCKAYNESNNYSLLAIQGPASVDVLKRAGILSSDELPYYAVKAMSHGLEEIILARTGYTGEDGFEVFCSHKKANEIWDALMSHNTRACGLGARDVLRLEVCYPLYGHELSDEVTPLDSGLNWTVKFKKENFIGKEALLNYKLKYQLVKLSLDKGIPRQDYSVENDLGEVVGVVRSGTMSVVLNKGIALAHIEKTKLPENKKYYIDIRGKKYEATVHSKPFVIGGHK